MTANVVNYLRERETERANLASEKETNRANVARETELNRSNLASEMELNRHNMIVEKETERHNRAIERITRDNVREQVAAQRYATSQQAQNVLVQTAATKEAAKISAQISAEASKFAARTSAGAANRRTTYDYLVGMANVSATRERNEIQDRFNKGNLAVASAQIEETSRHNRRSESLTERAQDLDLRKHSENLQETQWKNFNDYRVNSYNANTKRMDTIWRNANNTAHLFSKQGGSVAGSLKQSYQDWKITQILGY